MLERESGSEQFSKIKIAERMFKGDYANEFCGMDLALQLMDPEIMSEPITIDQFARICQDHCKGNRGKFVLKFIERYEDKKFPAPELYKKEIIQLDKLVDELNAWAEDFLKQPGKEKIAALKKLLKISNELIR